jgi:hypothetical protein
MLDDTAVVFSCEFRLAAFDLRQNEIFDFD